jgi:arylsulfatase A-like enzyme
MTLPAIVKDIKDIYKKSPVNILLLTVDCLRLDCITNTFYSNMFARNISNLASKGILFHETIANSSWTIPSFISLFTSTYSLIHDILTNYTLSGVRVLNKHDGQNEFLYPVKVRAGTLSLPCTLSTKQYINICINSAPHSYINRYLMEIAKHFKIFRGNIFTPISVKQIIVIPEPLDTLLGVIRCKSGFISKGLAYIHPQINQAIKDTKPYTDAKEIINEALFLIRKIRNRMDNNLFVWLHFMDAHEPYIASSRFFEELGWTTAEALTHSYEILAKIHFCPDKLTKYDLKLLNKFYNYSIKYVDECIGYFLEKLEEISFERDTLIILTADHGELLGEHNAIGHGGLLYDELIRVPLIIKGLGLPQGMKINSQISLMDLMPTILEILGINAPKTLQGKSRLYLIDEKDSTAGEPVISECIGPETYRFSYRTKDWKYILTIKRKSIIEELYNIKSNQGERENLAQMEKDLTKVFRERIIDHIKMILRYWRMYRERERLIQRIHDLKRTLATRTSY